MSTISERIIEIRGDLDREEFGAKIGVSDRTVQRWELEDALPKAPELNKISEIFHINVQWLVTGEGRKYIIREEDQVSFSDTLDIKVYGPDGKIRPEDNGLVESRSPVMTQEMVGLWGRTRHHDVDGERFAVTAYGPENSRNDEKPQPVGLGQAVDLLNTVLSSGNEVFIQALMSNLIAFSNAVQRDKEQSARIAKLENECEALKSRLAAVEEKLSSREPHHSSPEEELKTSTGT